MNIRHSIKNRIARPLQKLDQKKLYKKYKEFTMIPAKTYIGNLALAKRSTPAHGSVVECGVWRGGTSAALAETLGKQREYYLFDSFEGLPAVTSEDGDEAKTWQADRSSPQYFDNCKAEMAYAEKAMKMSGAAHYHICKGWFKDTLPKAQIKDGIALLRLDGDWYDSTMECLTYLFPQVVKGGLIIIDDYYIWEGSTKAVHEYLAKNKRAEPVHQSEAGIAYIIKE